MRYIKNSLLIAGRRACTFALLGSFVASALTRAADWPMLGRDATRNPASPEKGAPIEWDVKTGRNIKWKAKLGYITFGSPVVAGGLVWIGTNNEYEGEPPVEKPGGRMICFRESDGQLLYQLPLAPSKASVARWAVAGVTASPLIEQDRLWLTTLKPEVVCLDIASLRRGDGTPKELWKLDMETSLGVERRHGLMGGPQMCSIGASYGDFIYVITGNGRRISWDTNNVFHDDPPPPGSPALLCLDKNNGRIIWQDKSPGTNEILGEWASPLVATVDGRAQVIAPQGDGWLRSFDAKSGELLWKFDINPKKGVRLHERNFFVPPPVFYDGKIYISSGGYVESGEGPGKLVCIDPRKGGDISLQLENGEPNPNSGAIWHLDEFGRAMGTVAIENDLVIAAGFNGFVYCLDPGTGKEYWRHNLKAHTLSAPLVADNKIYLVDEDGEVEILELAKTKKLIKQLSTVGEPFYASPIYANGVLYIAGNEYLYAIAEPGVPASQKPEAKSADWPQWRGSDRLNASRETGLLGEWPDGGPPHAWSLSGLGQGIHSVSVADGRLFTTGSLGSNEVAFAIDSATGEKIWARRLGPTIEEHPRMRWLTQRSPTLDEDRVYVLTATAELVCLSTSDGKKLWQQSYPQNFGSRRPPFGYTDHPLIDGERLICTPSGTNGFVAALDKRTGEVIWRSNLKTPTGAGYAALALSEACGVRQYIVFHARGLAGFAANDGKPLWQYDRPNTSIASTYAPIARGDLILSPNGYGGGLALIKLSVENGHWNVTELYSMKQNFDPFQDNTALIGEHLYTCLAGGLPACFEATTGKLLWDVRPTNGTGRLAFTYADGHLYVRYANGIMALVEANPGRYIEKATFKIPDLESSIGVTFPIVARGRLYIRDNDRLHCFNISTNPAASAPTKRVAITLSQNELQPAEVISQIPRVGRDRAPDAVFVPTPHDVVAKMLELAELKKEDLLVGLGSGDGRIVIAGARKYGCHSIGYEIDKRLVEISREAVQKENLGALVRIEHEDLFTQDLSNADVAVAFLYPRLMERLLPQFQKLKPGSRIISHQFEIPGVPPDKTLLIDSAETGEKHRILLWTAPIKLGEAAK